MNEIAKLLKKEGGSNISELNKILDKALLEVEETPEEKPEETAEEETSEELEVTESEEAEETAEETAEEEAAEEETAEEEAAEEEEEPAAEDTGFKALMTQLAEELKSLREENASLKEQLAAKKNEEAEFINKFKKLSVSLGAAPKAQPAAEHKKVYTDGIGE